MNHFETGPLYPGVIAVIDRTSIALGAPRVYQAIYKNSHYPPCAKLSRAVFQIGIAAIHDPTISKEHRNRIVDEVDKHHPFHP